MINISDELIQDCIARTMKNCPYMEYNSPEFATALKDHLFFALAKTCDDTNIIYNAVNFLTVVFNKYN